MQWLSNKEDATLRNSHHTAELAHKIRDDADALVKLLDQVLVLEAQQQQQQRRIDDGVTAVGAGIAQSERQPIPVIVERVIDGDTVVVRTGDGEAESLHVRIQAIDAPETHQMFGPEAADAMRRFLANSAVYLVADGKDRYGRTVGTLFRRLNGSASPVDDDPDDVSLLMLGSGAAWHYTQYNQSEQYAAAEKSAREHRLGLWAVDNPQPPWEWRREEKRAAQQRLMAALPTGITIGDVEDAAHAILRELQFQGFPPPLYIKDENTACIVDTDMRVGAEIPALVYDDTEAVKARASGGVGAGVHFGGGRSYYNPRPVAWRRPYEGRVFLRRPFGVLPAGVRYPPTWAGRRPMPLAFRRSWPSLYPLWWATLSPAMYDYVLAPGDGYTGSEFVDAAGYMNYYDPVSGQWIREAPAIPL